MVHFIFIKNFGNPIGHVFDCHSDFRGRRRHLRLCATGAITEWTAWAGGGCRVSLDLGRGSALVTRIRVSRDHPDIIDSAQYRQTLVSLGHVLRGQHQLAGSLGDSGRPDRELARLGQPGGRAVGRRSDVHLRPPAGTAGLESGDTQTKKEKERQTSQHIPVTTARSIGPAARARRTPTANIRELPLADALLCL